MYATLAPHCRTDLFGTFSEPVPLLVPHYVKPTCTVALTTSTSAICQLKIVGSGVIHCDYHNEKFTLKRKSVVNPYGCLPSQKTFLLQIPGSSKSHSTDRSPHGHYALKTPCTLQHAWCTCSCTQGVTSNTVVSTLLQLSVPYDRTNLVLLLLHLQCFKCCISRHLYQYYYNLEILNDTGFWCSCSPYICSVTNLMLSQMSASILNPSTQAHASNIYGNLAISWRGKRGAKTKQTKKHAHKNRKNINFQTPALKLHLNHF